MIETPLPIDDGLCRCRRLPQSRPASGLPLRQEVPPRHGYIHYENDHPWHPDMVFRTGAWHGMCETHYGMIIRAVR